MLSMETSLMTLGMDIGFLGPLNRSEGVTVSFYRDSLRLVQEFSNRGNQF